MLQHPIVEGQGLEVEGHVSRVESHCRSRVIEVDGQKYRVKI